MELQRKIEIMLNEHATNFELEVGDSWVVVDVIKVVGMGADGIRLDIRISNQDVRKGRWFETTLPYDDDDLTSSLIEAIEGYLERETFNNK